MAVSTRPVAAPTAPAPSSWPWHVPLVGTVRASLLKSNQRRMDAETYLTDGYGIRLAIEAKPSGWVRFSEIARASAPPRIKQILVSSEHGVPYLNTSQVFELRPKPRKWLAMGKTTKAKDRLVKEGTILVMASATVGRAIVASKVHENTIISHHFMRVAPVHAHLAGWVYAFLRSPQAQSMMTGSQYASVIRHIEPHHLATLPVPEVSEARAYYFQKRVEKIVEFRNNATRLTESAETSFAEAVGLVEGTETEHGFSMCISSIAHGRRRFEGAYHTPLVRAIIQSFKKSEPLGDITKRVWWLSRFKRIYGETGTPYMSANDIFTMNPQGFKKILLEGKNDRDDFKIKKDWIVMARSGQIYGLNGSATLTTKYHEGFFLSDDLIRIIPDETKARAGYLLTALTHPTLGRPLIVREAYGTSIPHLDPNDVAGFPVVRLSKRIEDKIADLAEEAASERAKADLLERELADDAEKVIADFLMRPSLQRVPTNSKIR